MLFSAQGRMLKVTRGPGGHRDSRKWVKIVGIFLLCLVILVEFAPFTAAPPVSAQAHVQSTVDSCSSSYFSPDGNPYMLCPGPYPLGGNCVWWAWEQWHLLGYDLPVNWGNAAEWATDAARSGLTVGTTPRVASIAVFPVADGTWASSPAGHVAFVTSVSADNSTFGVTYQNFGDVRYMYADDNYSVNVINQPRYQNGQLRFIYFPSKVDSKLFAQLPGIGSFGDPAAAINQANSALNTSSTTNTSSANVNGVASNSDMQQQQSTYTSDRIALGLAPASSDQEFNADFTGTDSSTLLLYNRQRGSIQIYKLNQQRLPAQKVRPRVDDIPSNDELLHVPEASSPLVDLGDATTPAGTWGSTLDIHVGNFSGAKASEILLYDRVAGTIQLLSLDANFHIKKHVTLPNIGPGWEISVGRFNGKSSGLFMYKRFSSTTPVVDPNAPDPSATNPVDPSLPGPGSTVPTNGPVVKSTPIVKSTPTVKATPTVKSTPTVTPTPKPTATVTPKSTVTPTPKPTATPTPTPTATPTPAAAVSPTATPTPAPAATPVSTPAPTQAATPAATARPSVTPAAQQTVQYSYVMPTNIMADTPPDKGGDLSGSQLAEWEKQGRSANVRLMDFNSDLSIHQQQSYTLWHSSWEVYVGRFVNAQQDGIFLYDRTMGEDRIMDFDQNLGVRDYHEQHNLDGNWVVYSGDFINSGRSQLLLYDPGSGDIQLLAFDAQLQLSQQKLQSHVGAHQVLYVGHFGLPTLSVMLYDSQSAQSTFVAFDQKLDIAHQYLVKTWDQRWQILVGAFTNRANCTQGTSCASNDTILVLNRQSGQLEQYVFSFGREFTVYDNRIQSFLREGVPVQEHVQSVDTTVFSMVNSLTTNIRNEELY
ncbi:CHAP domain-containing protein [Dictyobacter formicarum]|uniref:Peptidase C51 domain-containing protein n=1 Tax=Dictyobacter formicarum TaxID=2778368 RepID=A0ABQ3VFB7_9CHLR|nr:CHAP domain-containing protein [Dictyobacter formicarum]GHO84338.1 hypothetical protein KSZ_23440 [Dictyobacter formicarum]